MYRYIIGNDSVYVIRNARSAVAPFDPIPISAAGGLTVRELPADGGAEVGGAAWPVTFAWSTPLNGFAGTIPGSAVVVDRGIYEITATLDNGTSPRWQDVEEMRAFAHG